MQRTFVFWIHGKLQFYINCLTFTQERPNQPYKDPGHRKWSKRHSNVLKQTVSTRQQQHVKQDESKPPDYNKQGANGSRPRDDLSLRDCSWTCRILFIHWRRNSRFRKVWTKMNRRTFRQGEFMDPAHRNITWINRGRIYLRPNDNHHA